MSNDPNRPYGGPNNELARLAQEGQARLQADHRGQDLIAQAAADRNVREAIGPVRGAPMRRAVLVLLVVSVVALVAGTIVLNVVVDDVFKRMSFIPVAVVGLLASGGLLFLYLFMAPAASRAGIEAERAWAASLPFALERYFDVIAAKPEAECRLGVELWWTGQGVDARTLEGVVALFGTQTTVMSAPRMEAQGAHASFTTGPISGSTGIRINRVYVHRNHHLGEAVHRLVEVVLMPLHRNGALARVRLSRAY